MGKILVLDDDQIFCKRARVTFEGGGHEVATTDSGNDAFTAVIRDTVEVIVLDLSMPKMDGSVFLQLLRTCGRWSATPVIIVTANVESEQFARVKRLGIQAAFDKTKLDFADL